MQTTVLVNGASGKMGGITSATIEQHPDFILVARVDQGNDLGQTINDTKPQIVIDFTNAASAYDNALTIIKHNVHPVIGTTGLLPDQINHLTTLCAEKKLGGIIAPNFSLGAILMMRAAAMAAKYLPEVEIIEAHHQQKLDAPSGTALKTATLIANARQQPPNELTGKELIPGARGGEFENVHIHSIRLPGFLAHQAVIFGNTGETLTITHNSTDRTCFMPGVILACQKVVQLDGLYYGLEQLID